MCPTRTPTSALERVERRRAHGQADLGALEEQEQQPHDREQHRHDAERLDAQPHAAERDGSSGKRLEAAVPEPQIQPARLFRRMKRPSVTITSVRVLASLEVPDQHALDGHAGEEGEPERRQHREPERHAGLVEPQAMNVLNIAISPWAKFTIAGGAEDQHERQGHAA